MKNTKLLRSFWALGVIVSLGMVFVCACSDEEEASTEATTWDYSFAADTVYVKTDTPPPADNQSANTTIGLGGVPSYVTRGSNKGTQETLPVSNLPYHINQHIQLTGQLPHISLAYDGEGGGAGAACSITIAGARYV